MPTIGRAGIAIMATLITTAGCGSGSPTRPIVDYRLSITSGNNQVATYGDTVNYPLLVTLTNAASGTPIPNAPVTWQVLIGNGTVTSSTTATDSAGTSSTRWILGPADSSQLVTARTPNADTGAAVLVSFMATGFARGSLHWLGVFDGDSIVGQDSSYDVANHYHFVIANAQNDSVFYAPVVNLPSVQWELATGTAPSPAPACSVAIDVLTLSCPPSSGSGFTGHYVVTVQEGSFDGIANPAYRGSFDLWVD
jgi:hypothetical protein